MLDRANNNHSCPHQLDCEEFEKFKDTPDISALLPASKPPVQTCSVGGCCVFAEALITDLSKKKDTAFSW